jgi:hypothetical protein
MRGVAAVDKLVLLRKLVANLDSVPLSGEVTQSHLDALPFTKAKLSRQGIMVGFRKEARSALHALANEIFNGSPRYRRGVTFQQLFNEVSDAVLINFFGRGADTLGPDDVAFVEAAIESWFRSKVGSCRFYIPCAISPWPVPAFALGPVRFSHLDEFSAGEGKTGRRPVDDQFGRMFSRMRGSSALWMATLDVSDCTDARASELANIAVDIALAALQTVIPSEFSHRMSRMDGRSRPRSRETIVGKDGEYLLTHEDLDPSLSMGAGLLDKFLRSNSSLVDAMGKRVAAYVSGRCPLPTLERAWADAAYWFHEGLAEPLDTIAVAKLETAIEVLLGAESTSGSKRRLLTAVRVFYGSRPEDFINPHSEITAEEFVEGLVRDRSRILHGTWSTLATNLSDSRSALVWVIRDFLAVYASELDKFATASSGRDDIEEFLAWIEATRAKPAPAG